MATKNPPIHLWTRLSSEKKKAVRKALAELIHGPLQMTSMPGSFEELPEPPPPAEVRRVSMERMREIGRALMVSGSRPPRQQMVEIGRALDDLLDQLAALADQPGRAALRRRILLGLRQRITSGG